MIRSKRRAFSFSLHVSSFPSRGRGVLDMTCGAGTISTSLCWTVVPATKDNPTKLQGGLTPPQSKRMSEVSLVLLFESRSPPHSRYISIVQAVCPFLGRRWALDLACRATKRRARGIISTRLRFVSHILGHNDNAFSSFRELALKEAFVEKLRLKRRKSATGVLL